MSSFVKIMVLAILVILLNVVLVNVFDASSVVAIAISIGVVIFAATYESASKKS